MACPKCLCTVAMPTVQPAPTAAWPGTPTVPGTDLAALASTPRGKGRPTEPFLLVLEISFNHLALAILGQFQEMMMNHL